MITVHKGDCREVLRTLPSESVHCVVTSPPYWGLRDYAIGKDAFGLEPTYQLYVENAVAIFRELRRVLRKDGTLWLNLGDSYVHSGAAGGSVFDNGRTDGRESYETDKVRGRTSRIGLKPKDLIGIPWRVAFALQADGWYLRQDIIWSKSNPMPESVRDRCTKAHEYLFLLSKSERYYYDADAIAESAISAGQDRGGGHRCNPDAVNDQHMKAGLSKIGVTGQTRNKRSVWEVATQPYSEAHFATFPSALIEPCIKAGTSEKGCCAKCGAPWVRVSAKGEPIRIGGATGCLKEGKAAGPMDRGGNGQWDADHLVLVAPRKTTGWSPSCSCNAAAVPCTVLDPFAGAGTTGLVADRLGRDAILIELNPTYAAMIERRIGADAGMFADIHREAAE
jgi:DNA modification methylase